MNTAAIPIQGIIFDLDGTLVSSRLDFAYLKRELACPKHVDLLQHVNQLPASQKEDAHRFIYNHEMQDAEQSSWLPGAQKFVHDCQAKHIPMAIITRNMRDAAMLKIQHNNIPIDIVLTRDDAPPKPDPSGLLQVANEWKIHHKEIIYIGDFLYDIEAAINASMWSCLYAPKECPEYAHKADLVIQDFSELEHKIRLQPFLHIQ